MNQLDYQQSVEAQYRQQGVQPAMSIVIDQSDWVLFSKICKRYNMTVSSCFHYLVKTHG